MAELDEKHLKIDLGMGRIPHSLLGLLEGLEVTKKILAGRLIRFLFQPLELFGAEGQQILGAFHRADEEQVPEMLDQLLVKEPQIMPGLDEFFNKRKDGFGFFLKDSGGKFIEKVLADSAQDFLELLVADILAAESHGLVEQALRIADAPVRGLRDQAEPVRGDGQVFSFTDIHEVVDDVFLGNLFKLKMLAARDDRGGHLVEFGRGKNENRARRRLFQGLEEGVEGVHGKHVDFVNDDDFIAAVDRLVFPCVPDGADLFHAPVGRSVDLPDVDRAVLINASAKFALVAGRRGGAVLAVERFGQNPGRRRFAHAAHARKNIGLGDAVILDGVLKGLDDGLLADHLLKGLGSVLPRIN